MKTYPLLIPKNIILPISILGFIFTVIGTLLKLSHWSFGIFTPNLVLSISIVFTLLAIFVVLLDIIKNPIKNKLTNDKEYALIISENLIFQVKLLKWR